MPQDPIIAITMGDPAGIGPEVIAKALDSPEVAAAGRTVVVGSVPVLQKALALAGSPLTARRVVDPADDVADGEVAVLETDVPDGLDRLPLGRADATAGRAAVEWAKEGARLALTGRVSAVATGPLNKHAAHLAGYEDVGHQEIYQSMTGAPHVATMLVTPGLRVVHLTTHRPLRLACDAVTKDNVLAKLRLTHAFFVAHGFASPRIAAAALNPHGGEGGLIGTEELDAIGPAIAAAREEGMDVEGPVPADTVFNQAIDGRFDVVLAMYHDQGHIAVKVHDWASSATTNLGLPFLRTSVDHGTAFDIAGQGVANPAGMVQAVKLAAVLAGRGRLADF